MSFDDATGQEGIVAEDDIVLLIAIGHVVATAGDDHVASEVSKNDVVVAVLIGA